MKFIEQESYYIKDKGDIPWEYIGYCDGEYVFEKPKEGSVYLRDYDVYFTSKPELSSILEVLSSKNVGDCISKLAGELKTTKEDIFKALINVKGGIYFMKEDNQ